ncbi:hypothetical protein KKC08_02090 [Patescibacteria group bacterium]|nr:hypothetical protein [Patescibacteria group bacterium]MCG2702749.1 hypothetical protein [Candidatus Parcubacteria bacterium]MBU4265450.1 hypothetical protein [Patescibacteria group bacterium]MBU4390500.1 hypothetical protein [Patescibacteria group bacterium]MBU4396930.1 hypothetical protein [Patescibacteria group bacterium]
MSISSNFDIAFFSRTLLLGFIIFGLMLIIMTILFGLSIKEINNKKNRIIVSIILCLSLSFLINRLNSPNHFSSKATDQPPIPDIQTP